MIRNDSGSLLEFGRIGKIWQFHIEEKTSAQPKSKIMRYPGIIFLCDNSVINNSKNI
jgi:hypothetical protein